MIYLQLFLSFLQIGALSFGGGTVSQEMLDRLLDQLNSL